MPLAFLTVFSFQFFVEKEAPFLTAISVSGYETLIYGTAVWLLKNHFKIDLALKGMRDVITFCATMTAAAACMGIAYVLMFYFAGLIPPAEAPGLIFEYMAGDALGILILVPLFLINFQGFGTRIWVRQVFSYSAIIQAFLVAALVIFVFTLETLKIHTFYLFFVPIIGIAVTYGVARVPVALLVTQLGIIYFSWRLAMPAQTVTHFFPFFILALTWTGLILGTLISEREHSRAQILKGDARVRALLDMTPDCMLIVDMTGIIIAANSNFAHLCNVSSEWLLGQRIENVIPAFHPALNGEASIYLPNMMDLSVDVSTSKVSVGDKFTSIVTVRDISSRKQAEVQIRQRRAATEQASRTHLTGSLAAVLAHELNQPLSAIMSYTSACRKTLATTPNLPAKAEEQLEKISMQAKRAGDIIRRLREFFQNSSLEIAPVDVSKLIHDTLTVLEDEITRTNTAIDVRVLEPLTAAIDQIQIEQVLINLIRNSLDALQGVPADQRKIRILCSRSMRGDIEVVINDTGPGISHEIADQLFNPFVTTRMSGMGLGLTISRSIIEAHNGRLWAELQSSSGAAMHFTIPLYQKV